MPIHALLCLAFLLSLPSLLSIHASLLIVTLQYVHHLVQPLIHGIALMLLDKLPDLIRQALRIQVRQPFPVKVAYHLKQLLFHLGRHAIAVPRLMADLVHRRRNHANHDLDHGKDCVLSGSARTAFVSSGLLLDSLQDLVEHLANVGHHIESLVIRL